MTLPQFDPVAFALVCVPALSVLVLWRAWRLRIIGTQFECDETVYVHQARVSSGGLGRYRWLIRTYLGERTAWSCPPPSRYGWILPVALLTRWRPGNPHALFVSLSAIGAAACVPLSCVIGWQLGGPIVGTIAAALSAGSALTRGMGRRGLQDTWVAALELGLVAAALSGWWPAIAVLTFLLLATKETGVVFVVLAIGLDVLLHGRHPVPLALSYALPAAAWLLVGGWLMGGLRMWWQVYRCMTVGVLPSSSAYSRDYGQGGARRALVDFVILSPVHVLAFVSVMAGVTWRTPAVLGVAMVGTLLVLVHAVLMAGFTVRHVLVADQLIRIVAALYLALEVLSGNWLGALVVAALMVVADYKAWHALDRGPVHDPITARLVRYFDMAP